MSFLPLKANESRHRSYTRTEESRYVFKANPGGVGGTVAATNSGCFSFEASEGGKPPVEQTGSHAGILGGEVDAAGKLVKGSSQHLIREGDQFKQEIRGEADPSLFVEQAGLKKPEILKTHPFDPSAPKQPMKSTMNEALDEFRCLCDFKDDPMSRRADLSALKGQ